MSFKKTAKAPKQSQQFESNVDWAAFNQHVYDAIMEATDNGENTNQVCFISGIVDTGTQPSLEPYTVYKWEDSEQQNKLLNADFGCYVEDDNFYIPNKPVDSVAFFVDFPEVQIDYSKFFGDGSEGTKPYRTLLAGEWDGVAQYTALSPDKDGYGGKSRVSKLAKATGVTKGNPPADFDIGELLGQPFTMDIEAKKGGDQGQFLNVKVSNPSSKHKAIPVPEHDVVPFGVMMNGDNDEDAVKQIYRKSALLKRLELAEEWLESDLKKQIEALQTSQQGDNSKSPTKEEKAPKKATQKPKKASEPGEPEGNSGSFDDDIPFIPLGKQYRQLINIL